MDSKSSRYQSRILREMRQNAENPFSPPSSTGSHGTVTLTSQLSIPDGESTRHALPELPILNTSVLGRTFPEWNSKGDYGNGRSQRNDENTQPSSPPKRNNDTESLFGPASPRLRANRRVPVVEDTMDLNPPARGNVTTLLETINKTKSENAQAEEGSNKPSSTHMSPKPQPNAGFTANAARRLNRQSHLSNITSMSANNTMNHTSRSFFVPNLSHINDFVSGTLRWSSLKNGTPIFVKHGRVYDKENNIPEYHADFESLAISHDEEKIFVSLDKIRDEVKTLQEHYEFLTNQAEQVQAPADHLATIKRLQARNDAITEQKLELQRALKESEERFQARNPVAEQKLELERALKESEEELDSERELLDNLHRKYEMVAEEKSLLKEDNLGLERQNEELFSNNKILQQNNTLLERDNNKLREKVSRLERDNNDLRDEVEHLQGEFNSNNRLREKVSRLERDNSDLRDQVAHLQGKFDNTNLREKVAKLQEQLDKNLSQKTDTQSQTQTQTRQKMQQPKGSMSGTGKSKSTKMTERWEPEDANDVSGRSTKRTASVRVLSPVLFEEPSASQMLSVEDPTASQMLSVGEPTATQMLSVGEPTASQRLSVGELTASQMLSVGEPTAPRTEQAAAEKQKERAPPVLTPTAKRVLNTLCQDHECANCMVCTRIKSHRLEANGNRSKKTVRVQRPVPATDRPKSPVASTSVYEDQHTLRPSQDPAVALAKVMKGLKDEERHIRTVIARKQAVYDECDPSVNKRLWKQLDAEIKGLRKRRDLKRDQIYDLHDVLEGQKANAQLMSQEAVDMTINSVLSRDPTWNGIMGY